ncbi:MAG TPA: SWIM zinc finger family protein, partial [Ktedonobacteraceae bacterium]|nr:SWIM zinc finger family protein [Ktedonobacteraceae bacterium]
HWHDYEWNYYSENRPRRVANGIKTKSERGEIGSTWWSKRWVRALESLGMGTRLTRGRSYARQGQVLAIGIEAGVVKAKVQGSMPKPYKITIRLRPLSDQDWEQVTDALASQAIFAARLLAGEMPANIEEAFGTVNLALFPSTQGDLQTTCSCPDWANPCKHIAAVYYILAERFDEDPFLIFSLRGRSKEQIIAALRAKRVETLSVESEVTAPAADATEEIAPRLEESLDTFWQAGEALNDFAVNPHDSSVNKAVLKRLGDAPFSIAGQNLTTLLAKAYDEVEAAALRKAGEDDTKL